MLLGLLRSLVLGNVLLLLLLLLLGFLLLMLLMLGSRLLIVLLLRLLLLLLLLRLEGLRLAILGHACYWERQVCTLQGKREGFLRRQTGNSNFEKTHYSGRRQSMLEPIELDTHHTIAGINLLAAISDLPKRDVSPKGTVACLAACLLGNADPCRTLLHPSALRCATTDMKSSESRL